VLTDSVSANRQGVFAGGQFGYNWQFAPNWLIGGEIDWNWININGSLLACTVTGCSPHLKP
jgi:outer membrane immunogenic protein